MPDSPLVVAVREGDLERAGQLLDEGCDVHGSGEQEWPALNYAAGRGDVAMLRLLLEHGADVFRTGLDKRTPYEIALAANRVEACEVLREAEERSAGERPPSSRRWQQRPYCRAYPLATLREFSGWDRQSDRDLSGDTVVFVHQDFSVTRSMWHGEDVLLDRAGDGWKQFCRQTLQFRVPHDFDLLPEAESGAQAGDPPVVR